MRSILAPLGLAVLLVAIPVHTDSRRFDLDDLSRVIRVSDPQFASDGHSIVAVVSRANLDEDRWDAELRLDSEDVDLRTQGRRQPALLAGRIEDRVPHDGRPG